MPHPDSFPATVPPPLAETPILIYGAGSTAGIYAIQLLNLAGYKQVIATASKKHHEYLHSLGATHTFDYNSPTLVEDVAKSVGGDGKVTLVVDCITAESTLELLSKIVSPRGKVALLLPVKEGGSVTNEKDQALWVDYPAEKSPFAKETSVIGVKTFTYREVRMSLQLIVISLQLCLTGRLLEQEPDAQDSSISARVWAHKTQSRATTGPRIFQGQGWRGSRASQE